jgi:glycosyltransferase involved in cell wall biosynthesis
VGGTNPSLLEALGCGNLIIAHDNEFNREVAGDIACYFTSASNIPALLKTIESLSLTEKAELANKARARIKEKYNLRNCRKLP